MTTKPPLVYADACDELNASAANKERLALNHFNFFLQTYCPQIGIDVAVADDIPYRGLPKKSNRSSKLVFEFWDLGLVPLLPTWEIMQGSGVTLKLNALNEVRPPNIALPSKDFSQTSSGTNQKFPCSKTSHGAN